MGFEQKKCKCGRIFFALTREVCLPCSRSITIESRKQINKSPYYADPPKKDFKQVSDEETVWMLGSFVRAFGEMGTSGPVTRFTPGTPGFTEMAAMYGGAR